MTYSAVSEIVRLTIISIEPAHSLGQIGFGSFDEQVVVIVHETNADLVVLSGCETGLGKISRGDELVGLTRAFIYAGTPSVVASLWKVEDQSTAALMGSFYKNLKTKSKAEALRQAQLELIRSKAGTELLVMRGVGGIAKGGGTPGVGPLSQIPVSSAHPYFWAPFVLVGGGK